MGIILALMVCCGLNELMLYKTLRHYWGHSKYFLSVSYYHNYYDSYVLHHKGLGIQ